MCRENKDATKADLEKYPKCEAYYSEVSQIEETQDIDLLAVKIARYMELANLAREKQRPLFHLQPFIKAVATLKAEE